MFDDIAIKLENLCKVYRLYNSPIDRLKESLHPLRRQYHHDFYALNDISLEVKKGDSVGIIGKNGSGKSTLLKILTGVLTPTSGQVIVNGKVSALLELGAGFNLELSGLENVYFNGMLMGYSREEMNTRLDDILSFADIGDFVNQPVKSYSSGMFVRLAFSVAVNVDPEILIVDEALSVGDIYFQQKCYEIIQNKINSGVTILFVSHDTSAVLKMCKRVVLLNIGEIVFNGETILGVSRYLAYSGGLSISNKSNACDQFKSENMITRHGDGGATIISISTSDLENNSTMAVKMFDKLNIDVSVRFMKKVKLPSIGIHLFDRLGNLVFASGTHRIKCNINEVNDGDVVSLRFVITFNIQQGEYLYSIGVTDIIDIENNNGVLLDRIDMQGPISVIRCVNDQSTFGGIVQLPMEAFII